MPNEQAIQDATKGVVEATRDALNSVANDNAAQRWLAIIGGGALASYGIRKKSVAGLALAGAGTYLIYAGASKSRPFSDGLETFTGPLEVKRSVCFNRSAA